MKIRVYTPYNFCVKHVYMLNSYKHYDQTISVLPYIILSLLFNSLVILNKFARWWIFVKQQLVA
jgi:hypothetical protein